MFRSRKQFVNFGPTFNVDTNVADTAGADTAAAADTVLTASEDTGGEDKKT